MNDLKYSLVEYDSHITYAVWTPDREDDQYMYGNGAEISIMHPYTEYIYAYNFPSGDGYEKLYFSKKFKNQRGKIIGQGTNETNTYPLFNMHYSMPLVIRAYTHKDYKGLATLLMSLALVGSQNRFGTEGVCPNEITSDMLNMLERIDPFWGKQSAEIHLKAKILEKINTDNWIIKLEKKLIKDIDVNLVLQSKAEFKERLFYKKYPRRILLNESEQLVLPL